MNKILVILIGIGTCLLACQKLVPSAPPDNELLDGPIDGLTTAEKAQFLAGDIAFNDDVFTVQTGLGPLFVAASCASCHAGDGKGHPFTTLTRFGQTDHSGNLFLHMGGPQLQNRAIPGYIPETIPAGATFSKFTPPANTGLGYLELVSDADIIAMSDPDDMNGDGISGVPNWSDIPSYVNIPAHAIPQNGKYICRFGKKASAFDLLHQTVNAYNQDMGITSTFNPKDVYSGNNTDPEISDKKIRDVVAYLQTLKVPEPRNQQDETIQLGKNIFIQIGCENCHKQALHTGNSPIGALAYKAFHPYTDLLLHDMGPALDDGYTEGSAKTYEWRTPPLWGLGLSASSQGGKYYLLHDGRASSIQQAIEMHGGEAVKSTDSFRILTESDKNALIKFLESL